MVQFVFNPPSTNNTDLTTYVSSTIVIHDICLVAISTKARARILTSGVDKTKVDGIEASRVGATTNESTKRLSSESCPLKNSYP